MELGIIMTKLYVFLILIAIFVFAGCIDVSSETPKSQADIDKNQGIYDNTARLYEEYKWKLSLVAEIQQRTDAQGAEATAGMYIEWKRRNNENIVAGERLTTYIIEHRDVLSQYWTSDILVLIAKNKVTFERDNQGIEQKIYSLQYPQKQYGWKIEYYGREGGMDLGILTFANRGKSLPDVKFKFVFYDSNGATYSDKSIQMGDVDSGKTIRKKVSLPGRYTSGSTWTQEKVFIYINGSLKEIMVYEDYEWKEEQVNTDS